MSRALRTLYSNGSLMALETYNSILCHSTLILRPRQFLDQNRGLYTSAMHNAHGFLRPRALMVLAVQQ